MLSQKISKVNHWRFASCYPIFHGMSWKMMYASPPRRSLVQAPTPCNSDSWLEAKNYFIFVFRIFKVIFNWREIYVNNISIEVVSSIQNQFGIISFCGQIKISRNFTCFLISKLTGIKHTIIFRNPFKFLNQNVCCIC